VENANLDDFVTGFTQLHLKSLDKDVDCEENVTLVRKDGTGEDTVIIKVARGHCPVVECAFDSIVDLDPKSCECKPLEDTLDSTVFDTRDMTNAFVRLDNNAKFTIREWAVTANNFEWSLYDATSLNCVDEVSTFADQYGRYRHTIFQAVTAECRGDLEQTKTVDTDTFTNKFNVIVWPIRDPTSTG
jgi:hypothetical protein